MIEFPHIMQVLGFLVSLGSLVTVIVMSRGKAAGDRVSAIEKQLSEKASTGRTGALEDRVDRLEDRTTSVEGELRHLPSREQTHAMEMTLRDLKGEIGVLTERMKPVVATSERLQEWLLEDAKESKRGAA
ncbi:MAG: hypothetical protein B7Y75_02050 [Azorhizobium sp. 35-67-5]|nr:MAG: hypothetical protein B7Y75_02050 [Azorhizobium sp. 35-67-5]OZA84785.1 MAG: hypothetical protein B7X76_06140 [Azorhizobium sp. 39-67-5]